MYIVIFRSVFAFVEHSFSDKTADIDVERSCGVGRGREA